MATSGVGPFRGPVLLAWIHSSCCPQTWTCYAYVGLFGTANRTQMDYRCPVFGPSLIQPILDLASTHLNHPIWILIQSTWLSPLKIGSRHNLIKPNFPNMLGPDLIQDLLKFFHSLLHQEVIINYVLYIENKCWKYTRLTQPHSTVGSCSLSVRVMQPNQKK